MQQGVDFGAGRAMTRVYEPMLDHVAFAALFRGRRTVSANARARVAQHVGDANAVDASESQQALGLRSEYIARRTFSRPSCMAMRGATIAVACVVMGCASARQYQGSASRRTTYGTELDWTDETPWSTTIGISGVQRLRTVDPHVAVRHIAGCYAVDPRDIHGGRLIYLFPNHEYAITDALGMGPEVSLELGTWTLSDGEVKLRPGKNDRPASEIRTFLLASFEKDLGDFRSLRFFVTSRGESIDTSVMVTTNGLHSAAKGQVRALIRITEYLDWPEYLRSIKSATEPMP